ncbi:MAG: ABC transporter ATP-binding protein [Candidatus Bathyarchaeia archaeon]|nr:ABC transporter ATP-binding protein [Candidatus Bathyarchaeota archaeon]
MNPIIKVSSLTKRFGGVTAVSNFSFELIRGEKLGLIGPNGAGKTTLFNLLTGAYRPDAGKIEFEGINIVGLPPHKICRLGLVKTHQTPQHFWTLTVRENLMVPLLSSRNVKHRDAEEECSKILKLVGLDYRKNVPANALLPTELRRLEVARALATKPKVLLLDEPFAGTREKEAEELIRIIDEIRKMGVTIMLIEHRVGVVAKMIERLIVMHKGEKLAEGTPQEILKSKAVVEAYLGGEAEHE